MGDRPQAPGAETAAADFPARPDDRLDDRLLAVRAAEGDDDAFAELVRRHCGALLALARRLLGDPAAAEDTVRDAFVSARQRLPDLRRDLPFDTWMHRAVTDRCLAAPSTPPPAARTAGPPEEAVLARALARLSPGQRACWVLRELQGLSSEEVAYATRSDERTVRARLLQARRLLAEEAGPTAPEELGGAARSLRGRPAVDREAFTGRVAAAVRAVTGPGRPLPLGAPDERLWVADTAAAGVLRAAADSVPGVRAASCRLTPRGGGVRVAMTLAVAPHAPLAGQARRARRAVFASAARALGLDLDGVDLEIADLLEPSADASWGKP
ncbi:RNA polymerase sigma factor [Thermobifida alba]|uniref:RNA polymerase sigma factor n=1 Tax=Thermobifida alba TaxID=53522 RepID=UPI0020C0017D|nr:RNA polymerase sigma factor [Thermobifida alba]